MSGTDRVTIPGLQAKKTDGEKSVDIVSAGDTVGVNLWGHANPLAVTMEEMIVVASAVRRGVQRALVSVDFPSGPLQEGAASAVSAAVRLVKEAGVDLVKLDGAADFPGAVVAAVTRAGVRPGGRRGRGRGRHDPRVPGCALS